MPISIGLSGEKKNIVDIAFGGPSSKMTISEVYVGDSVGSPRLVWRRVKPITCSLNAYGEGFVGTTMYLTASNTVGGSGRYTYTFRVNGSIVRTITNTTDTTVSVTYIPQFAGYYTVSVTVTDYADSSNTFTANTGFDAFMPMTISVSASPTSLLLGNNMQISWTIQNGQPPYSSQIIVYRDGSTIYQNDDVASPFHYSTDAGFGTYTAEVIVTDAFGNVTSGSSNGVAVYTYGYTTTNNVNVRSGAGTNYDVVATFSTAGTGVNAFSSTYGDDGYLWFYITYASIAGYIRSDFLVVP